MSEKKATNIVVLDLRKTSNSISDFFVIGSGHSVQHLAAIAKSIEKLVFQSIKESPWHIEGLHEKVWILLDYVNVVAHLFQEEQRTLYTLEKLWGDAKIINIEEHKPKKPLLETINNYHEA